MEEEKKNEAESVTANGRELPIINKNSGFILRLIPAVWFLSYLLVVVGMYAVVNDPLLMGIVFGVLLLFTVLNFISAFCGKKFVWANIVGIVANAPLVFMQGMGFIGLFGSIFGMRYLKVRKRTGILIDKTFVARGQQAYKATVSDLYTCIQKHDEAKLNEIVTRENEYFESVKDILYLPDEAEDVIARTYNMAVVLEGEGAAKSVRKRMKGLYETRNFAEMHTIFDGYAPRYDEWIRANVHGEPAAYTPEMDGEGGFDGWLVQRWGWKILCNIVNVVTLFLAKPFTICWMMRWECKHTVYKGKRLSFDGNGLQLWGRYILWWLLCIVTLGIYTIFLPIRLEKWKAKHTHLAGEIAEYGGGFDGWVIQRLGWNILCNIVNAITLFIAYPATLCWKQKWYYKHRVYDGVRLHFDGKGIQLFGKWIQWLLLCVVTLGIYSLFLPIRVAKWKAKHVTLATYKEYWGPKVKAK